MDERESISRWRKLPKLELIFVFVIIGIAVWTAYPFIQEFFKFELLVLYSYQWTMNSSGNITQITVVPYNNGTKRLTISKVFVNETLINSTEWGCRRGCVLDPRTRTWMYIAPKSMVFEEGCIYNLTIGTIAENSFSYLVKVAPEFVAEEEARIDCVFFHPSPYSRYFGYRVGVCIENNGTVPAIVVAGWCNGTQYDIGRTWVWPGDVGWEAICITFHLRWDSGRTYNFTIKTACGNYYNYITKKEVKS